MSGDDREPVQRESMAFPTTDTRRRRGWWRLVRLEHLLTPVVSVRLLSDTGERWDEADRSDVRQGPVGVAVVGVLAGLWRRLTGRLPGLVPLVGGHRFLDRGVRGGSSR